MIGTLPQKLLFFTLICQTLSTNQLSFAQYLHLLRENQEHQQKIDDDEKLLQDLGQVTADFYKKIIETTMLYFTGMLMNSDQFHKQLILETNKHMLYASQIVTQYLAKLLKNPKVSWKVKIKRCACITSFIIIMILWMQEYQQKPIISDGSCSSPPALQPNLSLPSANQEIILQHRQRPPLY